MANTQLIQRENGKLGDSGENGKKWHRKISHAKDSSHVYHLLSAWWMTKGLQAHISEFLKIINILNFLREKKKDHKRGTEIEHGTEFLFGNSKTREQWSNAFKTSGKMILNLRFHTQTNLVVSSWNKVYFQCAGSQLYLPFYFIRKLLEDLLQTEGVYWDRGGQNSRKQTPHTEAQ